MHATNTSQAKLQRPWDRKDVRTQSSRGSASFQPPLLGLIPLRHGQPQIRPQVSRAILPLRRPPNDSRDSDTRLVKPIVLGRIELLGCMHAACGCPSAVSSSHGTSSKRSSNVDKKDKHVNKAQSNTSNPNNIYSTKHKCPDCRQVHSWAIRGLSRQMLRIRVVREHGSHHPRLQLSVRGTHAAVMIHPPKNHDTQKTGNKTNNKSTTTQEEIDAVLRPAMPNATLEFGQESDPKRRHLQQFPDEARHPSKWRGQFLMDIGTVLSIVPLSGEGKLEFVVVPLDEATSPQRSARSHSSYRVAMARCEQLAVMAKTQNQLSEWTLPPPTHFKQGSGSQSGTGIAPKASATVDHPVSQKSSRPVLWFCPLGVEMSRQRIALLSQTAQNLGLQVESERPNLTTVHYSSGKSVYWVVSAQVATAASLARYFDTGIDELTKYLGAHQICCVLPKWILSRKPTDNFIKPPALPDLWFGYIASKKRGVVDPETKVANSSKQYKSATRGRRNILLSEAFKAIAKLYQQSPVLPEDVWKAYIFHKLAGRLLHLGWEILESPEQYLPMLQENDQMGFSGSAISLIWEFSQTGCISRIQCLRQDPFRVAVKNMMSIWGVGRATALDLVQAGYHTIDQVRDGIQVGQLMMTRNQLVGVECYEDLLEEMQREEVEMIGRLIIETFHKLFGRQIVKGRAEASIMGSFRRGKKESGDVDVLVTMGQDLDRVTPWTMLSMLVDCLFRQGHIAYHLTRLPGMQTALGRHQAPSDLGEPCLNQPENMGPSTHLHPKDTMSNGSSSYMGVFLSPKLKGKRRRVDIKIYPSSRKAFACLYFTGSAHFNRSMRLWAKQRFNFKLTDKGLFDIPTGKSVIEATTEEQIFQRLRLEYKVPAERSFFDDVIPLI